jgi:hypothetical protein
MVKKARSPRVNELCDPKTYISTENHMQMFDRLVAALTHGIHNHPGPRKPKKG